MLAGKAPKAARVSKGFAGKDSSLVEMGKRLAKNLGKEGSSSKNPKNWFDFGADAAQGGEYAEARMIFEAGIQECGLGNSEMLVSALGQMRRIASPATEAEIITATWPGKGDDTRYIHEDNTFARYSVPQAPPPCARGTIHKNGEGIVCVSKNAILNPKECAWVISEVERVAADGWKRDKANNGETIGTDKIWKRPFPDRVWMREIPGVLGWFESRLRSRLFPMLHALYPEIIPSVDALRCHDAFVVRYDAAGNNQLEVHQDTTSFSFTIALNDIKDYRVGGTVFPLIRPALSPHDAPFTESAISAGVGGVVSFPGQLWHGGAPVMGGYRYIIPLFIYLDFNFSKKKRGHLLETCAIPLPCLGGVDKYAFN
jgi:hypothetical protein